MMFATMPVRVLHDEWSPSYKQDEITFRENVGRSVRYVLDNNILLIYPALFRSIYIFSRYLYSANRAIFMMIFQ